MSTKLCLEVALRIMGIWYVLNCFGSVTTMIWILTTAPRVPPSSYLIPTVAWAVQFLLGAALIYWAPSLAARFYPSDGKVEESRNSIGPGDLYRIACCVLGVYLLVHTAEPASRLAIGMKLGWHGGGNELTVNAVRTIVNTAAGILLVFGSRRISAVLSNLRYDPDTIPEQQFSIRILLVLLVLIAIVLAVIQSMTP